MIYKYLLSKIKGKRIALLGELHGTKEIPEIIANFLGEYAKTQAFNICMEIPIKNQHDIDNFLKTGKISYLTKMNFFKYSTESDGRNSLEYFNLIKSIYSINSKYNKQIKIFCIDTDEIEDHSFQNKRESIMAERIKKVLSEKITFAILGNVHASKYQLSFGEINICPTGYILSQEFGSELLSINICPKKGYFHNINTQKVSYDETFNKYFDYTYTFEKANKCSFLKTQQNIGINSNN